MNCQELQRFVQAYVDGEFDEEERAHFAAHLASCERCSRAVEFETTFRDKLRTRIAPIKAPPHLAVRIREALDDADRGRLFRLWQWRLIPAGAAVAVMAMALVVWYRSSSEAALGEFVEATIASHRQELPLDIHASKAAPIRKYFANKVPFAVRPPHFSAKLVGARLSNLRQHQAAYLSYRVGDGNRVSVFIVDPNALPSGSPRERIGDQDVSVYNAKGYQVATFRSGGTGYAVAGDLDRRRLIKLISSF